MILTSEKQNKPYALAETLKGLTINDARYYESDPVNANDSKGNPTSDPKVATHTSDGKKRKVMYTINGDLQQKLLSNWNLLIITTKIDPQIDDRIETCGGTPHTLATPTTKEVIMNASCSSA